MLHQAELTECVRNLLDNYEKKVDTTEEYRKNIFGDSIKCSKMIMDIVDDCVEGRKIRYTSLKRAKEEKLPIKQYCFHISTVVKRAILYNYGQRNRFIGALCKLWIRIRHGKEAQK